MIGVFPDPHPDEIFYSICARLCQHVGYLSHRVAMRDLFGRETTTASIVLPSHLDDFVSRLPPESAYTSDYLIAEHTLLPLYSPFLPVERLSRLQQDMRGRNGPALHMRSGIMASSVPVPEWLRYCPQCVLDDRKKFGECYWHRVHQVPGVETCPFHEILLHRSDIRARHKKTRHEYISAEHAISNLGHNQLDAQSPYHQILLNIARDVYWLLHRLQTVPDLKLLQQRYRKLLSKVDLATYRGRVDVSMFLQIFKKYYPPQLLQLLHCELEDHVQETWLLRLVHTPSSTQHPLHHLLLIQFFGHTAKDFFDLSAEYKPFGDGPWPCLNPICNYYCQAFIQECQVRHSPNLSGRPIGIFSCECGFSYSRVGPDKGRDDQFKRNTINAYGTLWETRLRELWEDRTVSLRAIARQLGVDPLTIKRQAARIGLAFPRSVCTNLIQEEPQKLSLPEIQLSEIAVLEIKRNAWLTTMQAYPEAGMKILRGKNPSLYTWLYRNDKTWLQEHKPLPKKPKQQSSRVDWEARDLQLAEEVRAVTLRLKNLPGRPVCITISSVGREIGRLALLQKHLDKLPKTADTLNSLIENREDFAIRRVYWVIEQYHNYHIKLSEWELIRKAGIERVSMLPAVKQAVETGLHLLSEHECGRIAL